MHIKLRSVITFQIDQTSLGMPSRDYYLKGRNDSMLLAYQKMKKDLAIAFGADPDMAEQDAKDLVDFEIELANVSSMLFCSFYTPQHVSGGVLCFHVGRPCVRPSVHPSVHSPYVRPSALRFRSIT